MDETPEWQSYDGIFGLILTYDEIGPKFEVGFTDDDRPVHTVRINPKEILGLAWVAGRYAKKWGDPVGRPAFIKDLLREEE